MRVFGHIGVEVIHQHAKWGFSEPRFGAQLCATRGANGALSVQSCSLCR
ncbi:Uncharacterised protein [Vibrio cholerae]|nr:Uncharacterised protein [Vibrio cholerae]